ncbi:MAG: sulfatase-like hydrolase/transferase [Deltaproteobacteria bacterium]|nr:sulfatase-like hydrolase/transferase [Deltaproteobacteria bacterium]
MQKIIVPGKTPCLLLFFMLICLSTVSQAMGDKPEKQKQPNILLIIADDFGVDVTSGMYPGLIDDLEKKYGPSGHNHAGYKSIRGLPASTPRLDKLSSEGMVFTNVWAHPFCSPTRSAIITGLFGKKAKVLTYADALSQKHTTFVKKLKDEGGYSTALFGKWHLAGLPGNGNGPDYPGMKPKEAGFDLFRGNLHAAIKSFWDYDYHIQDEETPANVWRTEKAPVKSLPGIAPTNYSPVVKIADAIEWITKKERETPDKPWFAWVAYNLSHTTIIQQPNAMAVPNMDTMDAKSIEEMKACGGQFGSNSAGNCSDESLMRAMTNSLDTITGKLLDAVNALDPNTYVIFVSDNGTPMYERQGLEYIDNMYITRKGRGKGTTFESGALVPMVIKGPEIKAGSKNSEIIHVADLFSTVLSIAGLKLPEEVSNSEGNWMVSLDSVSLSPIIFGKKDRVRDPDRGFVLSESINLMTNGTQHVGARNARYKVICAGGFEDKNCTFYDLDNDPLEEYPLEKPGTCEKYKAGTLTSKDKEWHYCRLMEVISEDSYANGIGK